MEEIIPIPLVVYAFNKAFDVSVCILNSAGHHARGSMLFDPRIVPATIQHQLGSDLHVGLITQRLN